MITIRQRIPRNIWLPLAESHANIVHNLLYPEGDTNKQRLHNTKQHPIYNFLHTYYRYPIADLKKYSPGMNVILDDINDNDIDKYFIRKYLYQEKENSNSYIYKPIIPLQADGSKGWININRVKTILENTINRTPNFACFGLHEWAMLYSGRVNTLEASSSSSIYHKKNGNIINLEKPLDKHQDVPLRVTQNAIDDIVEGIGLHCTHYDAFRFFHPRSQPFNDVNPLTRETQHEYETPACVHASMDLFKYAYQIYPFIDSELLIDSIQLALACRKVDMLASPYDVSQYVNDEPIRVETSEGRKAYILEQEKLIERAAPIRQKLLALYSEVLDYSLKVIPNS